MDRFLRPTCYRMNTAAVRPGISHSAAAEYLKLTRSETLEQVLDLAAEQADSLQI